MKQINLYVLLVLSALLVLLGMMMISMVTSAMAEAPVQFDVCDSSTCKAVDEDTQKIIGSGSTAYLLPSSVVAISSLHKCSVCAKVLTREGKTVYVLMAPLVASCVLFGGEKCTSVSGK